MTDIGDLRGPKASAKVEFRSSESPVAISPGRKRTQLSGETAVGTQFEVEEGQERNVQVKGQHDLMRSDDEVGR